MLSHHKTIIFRKTQELRDLFIKIPIEILKRESIEALVLITSNIFYEDIFNGASTLLFYFESNEDIPDAPTYRILHAPNYIWNESGMMLLSYLGIIMIGIFGLFIPIYIIIR
jgi:hypothetical protein